MQRAPGLFQLLRVLIDERIRTGETVGQFLLLGSAAPDLLRQSGESLAGRIAYLEVSPLDVRETGDDLATRLWVRGGFRPESPTANKRQRRPSPVVERPGERVDICDRHALCPAVEGRCRSCGMVFHMKTTLNIDDSVMQRLREEEARRGTTMSALVEAGLRRVLAAPDAAMKRPETLPPLPTCNSGGHLVDIDDRDALYRAMEEEEE